MFIDIHTHMRRLPGFMPGGRQEFSTPEQLIQRYDAIGVEKAAVLPFVSPEVYHPQDVMEVLEVCRGYGGRFIPFCNIDPRVMTNSADAPLNELLEFYIDEGCKGIGEVMPNLPISDARVQNLFRHVEAAGMPLIFHLAPQIGGCYGLYDEPGLPQLEESLRRFPHLRFLGHSQPFWAEMAPLRSVGERNGYPNYPIEEEGVVPKLFRRYENLYGDLSAGSGLNALARDPDYAVNFINEFQDRLLFGTDICSPDTPTGLVDFLLDLKSSGKISETVFNKLARENAIRLLDI